MLLSRSATPRWVIMVIDQVIALFSLGFAYLVRFDLKADITVIQHEWEILSRSILIFFVVKGTVFFLFRIHKGLVRHTSTSDMWRIFLATLTTSLIYWGLGWIRFIFFDGYFLFPTSVLIMEFMFCFLLMVGSRFFVKAVYLESHRDKGDEERVLIYGAGISGLITKRTIEKDSRLNYKIIGFLDDNPKLSNTRLEGIRVFSTSRFKELVKDEGVTLVILAIQDPDEENRRKMVELCLELNVKIRKVPSPKSWINGEFSSRQISKINIDDLLGRKPIKLDIDRIKAELKGKVILVTGAAGSIGSGLVRQIAKYEPSTLVLLDQAESPLYDLQISLRSDHPELVFEVVIGDIRSPERMRRLFEAFHPEYVFHAAAYKHVPLMEENPSEAVLTNVSGTKNL
jgi:FlaA1/EpsC-like NDP-sugar epimerase